MVLKWQWGSIGAKNQPLPGSADASDLPSFHYAVGPLQKIDSLLLVLVSEQRGREGGRVRRRKRRAAINPTYLQIFFAKVQYAA